MEWHYVLQTGQRIFRSNHVCSSSLLQSIFKMISLQMCNRHFSNLSHNSPNVSIHTFYPLTYINLLSTQMSRKVIFSLHLLKYVTEFTANCDCLYRSSDWLYVNISLTYSNMWLTVQQYETGFQQYAPEFTAACNLLYRNTWLTAQ